MAVCGCFKERSEQKSADTLFLLTMYYQFILLFVFSRRVRRVVLADVFERIDAALLLEQQAEGEHALQAFRALLHERSFSLVLLSSFFSQVRK